MSYHSLSITTTTTISCCIKMPCNCPDEVCERGGCACEGRTYSMLLAEYEADAERGVDRYSEVRGWIVIARNVVTQTVSYSPDIRLMSTGTVASTRLKKTASGWTTWSRADFMRKSGNSPKTLTGRLWKPSVTA